MIQKEVLDFSDLYLEEMKKKKRKGRKMKKNFLKKTLNIQEKFVIDLEKEWKGSLNIYISEKEFLQKIKKEKKQITAKEENF
jgi:hypothetical protein